MISDCYFHSLKFSFSNHNQFRTREITWTNTLNDFLSLRIILTLLLGFLICIGSYKKREKIIAKINIPNKVSSTSDFLPLILSEVWERFSEPPLALLDGYKKNDCENDCCTIDEKNMKNKKKYKFYYWDINIFILKFQEL